MFFIFLKKKLLFFGTRVVSEWKTYAVGGIRFLRRLLSGLRRGRMVRIGGLEPPRLSSPDPKSGAATNYAISAWEKRFANVAKIPIRIRCGR